MLFRTVAVVVAVAGVVVNLSSCGKLFVNAVVSSAVLVGAFLLASPAEAASVFNCSGDGHKCVVKVESGVVGDTVKVLDEKAHVVAFGRIVKRKGTFAVVSLTQISKEIRKGYPVIVNVEQRSSNLQWAASFSSPNE